jgi:hypothetical protein
LGSFKDDGAQLWPTSMQGRWTIFDGICTAAAVLGRTAAE